MQTTESVTIDAPAAAVYPFVADLGQYPRWLKLVHAARPVTSGSSPAWDVELRAQVGPFARSKRLRMERVDAVVGESAVFERAEIDGRDHAGWTLRVELAPDAHVASTLVTMHLAYDGRLWTGGALERVLDDQVRRGRAALIELVSGEPRP